MDREQDTDTLYATGLGFRLPTDTTPVNLTPDSNGERAKVDTSPACPATTCGEGWR